MQSTGKGLFVPVLNLNTEAIAPNRSYVSDRPSGSHGGSSSTSLSMHQQGRPLLMPDEVRRLQSDTVLVLQQGCYPLALERLDYLLDKEYAGKYGENPMYVRKEALASRK